MPPPRLWAIENAAPGRAVAFVGGKGINRRSSAADVAPRCGQTAKCKANGGCFDFRHSRRPERALGVTSRMPGRIAVQPLDGPHRVTTSWGRVFRPKCRSGARPPGVVADGNNFSEGRHAGEPLPFWGGGGRPATDRPPMLSRKGQIKKILQSGIQRSDARR